VRCAAIPVESTRGRLARREKIALQRTIFLLPFLQKKWKKKKVVTETWVTLYEKLDESYRTVQ